MLWIHLKVGLQKYGGMPRAVARVMAWVLCDRHVATFNGTGGQHLCVPIAVPLSAWPPHTSRMASHLAIPERLHLRNMVISVSKSVYDGPQYRTRWVCFARSFGPFILMCNTSLFLQYPRCHYQIRTRSSLLLFQEQL